MDPYDDLYTLRAYIVRLIEGQDLVGVFAVKSLHELERVVDECTNTSHCEFAEVPMISVIWPGSLAPKVSRLGAIHDESVDLSEPLHAEDAAGYIGDTMTGHIQNIPDGCWYRFGAAWVYFVQAGKRVKIGFAKDVDARLKTLQTGSADKLTLLRKTAGTKRDEAIYHRIYSDLHVNGEWFKYEGALRSALEIRL